MNEILHIVQSQDLKVNSEQDVIKAILHWTEFKPSRLLHNVSTIREMRCKRFKTLTINKFESNETIAISDQSDSKPQNISSDNREQYLGILLSKARLCLVSRESLEMLLCNPLVSENKMANDVVNKALLYKVQIGKRNGQWPTAAIHRNESDFENVAMTTKRKENGDLLLQTMSFPRNNFLHLDVRCLIGREFVAFCTMDNILYYFFMAQKENQGHNASVYAYRLIDNEFKAIKMYLVLKYAKFYVTVIDDFIYILPSNGKVMGRLHPVSESFVSLPTVPADPTIKDGQAICHVINYEHMILAFSSVSEKGVETVVQCYDTSQNIWTRLNNLEGPAKGMTSFRDDHFTYILQSNGDLWKMVRPQSDSLDLEFVANLWSCDWSLVGAITFFDKLYICGVRSEMLSRDPRLSKYLPGIFGEIVYINSELTETEIFLPITLRRKYMF